MTTKNTKPFTAVYEFRPAPDGVDYAHVARVMIARHDAGLTVHPNLKLRRFAEEELRQRMTVQSSVNNGS